ncbi:histidine phosphatase family protein [Vibrio methylphosphonaticus]|uniref:histidine phosphatase family protein n=1 Tax=Vibrio methylphosphonaticus TaxID=2946866 RepID=UPI00202A4B62|nr:histidine phosphatase family protein [Vibrio methylphosphonaticus]MCL9774796.1 histidine phosphatase family protein [Vibrio methylphosphonaticus]
MINIYLLRHGKVTGEAALYGHTDIAVSSEENAAIASNLHALSLNLKQVITSPLLRCHAVAQQFAHQQALPLSVVSDLSEMYFGDVDGVPFDTMSTQEWQNLEPFWENPAQTSLPNAESLCDFHTRVVRAWASLSTLKQDTLVVTHGGVIRVILAHLLELDWRNAKWYSTLSIQNGSLTHIQINPKFPEHVLIKAIGTPIKGPNDD